MIVHLSAPLRRRALHAIAALLVAAVLVTSVESALASTSGFPTVGDYLGRVVRAAGLESLVGPGASADKYLSVLVEQHVITADPAHELGADQPLTHDVVLEVSGSITDPPAPSFLSQTYVGTTFLADHGTALGFVSDSSDNNQRLDDLFEANGHERRHHCPTPRHRHASDDDRSCPREP